MDKRTETILVTGATGQQGGAVIRHLLRLGWQVRALTRNPHKPQGQALTEAGAEVVQGDLNDIPSTEAALNGVYGVFSVQAPTINASPDYNVEVEVLQGKRLGDLAKAAQVKHFVYSSAGGAIRNSRLPHVDSKWRIEQHLRSLDLPLTIFYPVFFMDNLNWNRQDISNGTFSMALKPDTRLQMISAEDIGAFVALAFENPADYIGKGLEIAGDELTMQEAAAVFASVLSHEVTFEEQPIEQLASFAPDMAETMREFTVKMNQADISSLRQRYPQLMNLAQWLRFAGWSAQ